MVVSFLLTVKKLTSMPINCEQEILDIPLTPSAPDGDDLVMFTLPDGTTVTRKWSTVANSAAPDDIQEFVTASGGSINNGDTNKTYSQYVGRRVRFFRGGLKQGTVAGTGSYYAFNIGSGQFTFTPAAVTGELFQFESY